MARQRPNLKAITPTELSRLISKDRGYISKILSGKREASLETAVLIFNATGMKLGRLASLSDGEIRTIAKMVEAA